MKIKPVTVLALFLVIFFLIELKGVMHYDNVDENIYFYMGKLIAEGKTPYADFFYAHPPLKIYVNALIILIFGVNFFLLKLVPLISTIISAIFIFRMMKHHFSETEGLCASALFLSSFTVMSESTYATGINITLMLAIVGLYYTTVKKHFVAGIFAGLSGISGLYALVYVPIIMLFVFVSSRKNFLKYCLGFSLIFITINLIFLVVSHGAYLDQVYKYHLLKPAVEGNTFKVFQDVIAKSPILFALAALFVFYYTKKLQLVVAIAGAYIIFLLLLSRIFNFYFMLLLPLLAMLAAYAWVRLGETVNMKQAVLVAGFCLIGISAFMTTQHLFEFDFVSFASAHPMADFVAKNSHEEGTIFGDDTATPLIAIFSQRKIWHDKVDTNYMVFGSGLVSLQDTINELRADPPSLLVIRPIYNIAAFSEFKEFLEKDCEIVQYYRDPQWGDFAIYDCKQS